MQRIAIVGSTHWHNPDPARAYVDAVVARAVQTGHWLYVGDSPHGVDAWVVDAVQRHDYRHKGVVFGIEPQPRNIGAGYYIWERLGHKGITPLPDYTVRDRYMIGLADRFIGVWNGTSLSTQRAYQHAKHLGKTAALKTFGQSPQGDPRYTQTRLL